MTTLLKFFQKQSLPTSNEVELPDAVRREFNSTVQKVLEEERSGVSGRKRKYTHFTPEDWTKIAKYTAQCGNTVAVKDFAIVPFADTDEQWRYCETYWPWLCMGAPALFKQAFIFQLLQGEVEFVSPVTYFVLKKTSAFWSKCRQGFLNVSSWYRRIRYHSLNSAQNDLISCDPCKTLASRVKHHSG